MPKKKNSLKEALKKMGNNKKSVPTEQEEKALQADRLKARDNLLAAMDQVIFACPGGEISKEFLDNQKMIFASMKMRLDNSKTASMLDTQKIDNQLRKLCDDLQEALKNGDEITVRYIMKAFAYGIYMGHKTLLKSEEEKIEYVMDDRLENMENYSKICECSVELYKEGNAIQQLSKRIDELGQDYVKEMKLTSAYIDEHPDLYQQILELGGSLKKMNPDQYKLGVMMQNVLRLDHSIEQVVLKEAIHQGKLNALKGVIDTLETQLKDYNSLIQEELTEFINTLTEKETIRITQGIVQVENLNEAMKNLHNAYMNAFQTPKIQQFLVNTAGEFDDLRIKYESERDSFGRYIRQDIELEDEIEVENEDELFN